MSPHSTTSHKTNTIPNTTAEDGVNNYLNKKFSQDAFQNIGVENSSVAPFLMIIPMCRWYEICVLYIYIYLCLCLCVCLFNN